MMTTQIKAKVTSGLDYNRSRPPSPLKTLPTSTSPTPAPRPRAKVNSSATIGSRKVVSSSSLAPASKTNATNPRPQVARAPSPFRTVQTRAPSPHRPPQLRATVSSSAQPQKAKVGARANITAPATPIPELRQRALTGAPGSTSDFARVRRGSVSSHVSASPSSVISRSAAPSPPRLTVAASEDGGSYAPGHLRVKSKVSRIADNIASQLPHSLPSSPSFPSFPNRPARVPSISNLSLSPPLANAAAARPPPGSPIGAAGAGHGRSATTRDAPMTRMVSPQTGSARDDGSVNYSAHVLPTKVDPTTIPLPPYSPPVSTVSFSSRSSASRSSTSYDTHTSEYSGSTAPNVQTSRPNGTGHVRTRSSIDALGIPVSPLSISREPSREASPPGSAHGSDNDNDLHDDEGYDDPERKRRNEAKSNRKIADLEITNKSLLAINSSLEAQKSRQAKEIRDLRRRLRESILVLPPQAYRAAKSSLTEDGTLTKEGEEEDVEEEEEEDEAEQQELLAGKNDESYRRVRTILEALLESGKRALESKPQDFLGGGAGGTRVLSEEEARQWRGGDSDARSFVEPEDGDDSSVHLAADGSRRPVTPSQIAIPDDELDDEFEDKPSLAADVDESTHFRRSQVPPITVTPSQSP